MFKTRVNNKQSDLAVLQQAILTAHAQNNTADLINHYTDAATLMENNSDIDAACFYLTQAYIYALDSGSEYTEDLHERLAKHGRVAPS